MGRLPVNWPAWACLAALAALCHPQHLSADGPAVAEKPAPAFPPGVILRIGDSAFRFPASAMTFSPDGRSLALAAGSLVRLVDAQSGQQTAEFRVEAPAGGWSRGMITSVGYSPDGQTLIACSDDMVLWDVATGKPTGRIELNQPYQPFLEHFVLSPDLAWRVTFSDRERKLQLAKWDAAEPAGSTTLRWVPRALAVSGGGTFAAAGEPGRPLIHVWKGPQLEPLFELETHDGPATHLAFSHDGRRLYAAAGGAIRRWKLEDGSELPALRRRQHPPHTRLVLSRDDKTLAAGTLKAVHVYDAATGEERFRFEPPGESVRDLVMSPEGRTLAVRDNRGRLWLWDLQTGQRIHQPVPEIRHAFVTEDVRQLGSTSAVAAPSDESAWFWDLADGRTSRRVRLVPWDGNGADRFTLFHGGRQLVMDGQRQQMAFRDLARETEFRTIADFAPRRTAPVALADCGAVARLEGTDTIAVRPLSLSPGRRATLKPVDLQLAPGQCHGLVLSRNAAILAATFFTSQKQRIDVWDLQAGQQRHSFPLSGLAQHLTLSADGRLLAARVPSEVVVWDLQKGTRLHALRDPPGTQQGAPRPMEFSRDGKLLAACETRGVIHLWDVPTGQITKTLRIPGPVSAISDIAFSSDGKQLAVALTAGPVHVVDVDSGQATSQWKGQNTAARCVRFLPDDEHLVLGTFHGPLHLWEIASGRTIAVVHDSATPFSLAVSEDGMGVAVGDLSGAVTLFESARLGKKGVDPPPVQAVNDVRDFAYIEAAQLLALALRKEVRLIDLKAGRDLPSLAAENVRALEVVRDGRTLLAVGSGITAWDLPSGEVRYHIPVEELPRSVTATALSPDGRLLATDELQLRNAETGELVRQVRLPDFNRLKPPAFSADGRLLFVAHQSGVWVVEVASGLRLGFLDAREQRVQFIAPAGPQRLVTGMLDGTALLWSLRPPDMPKPPPVAGSLAIQDEWRALHSEDSGRILRALCALADAGDATVEFLEDRLAPAAKATRAAEIEALIDKLDDSAPEVRQQASAALRALENAAAPSLKAALEGELSPRAKARLRLLLAAAEKPSTDVELVSVRTVQVLEWIGTPAARDILERLAAKASDPRMAIEAKVSLKRLGTPP